MRLRSVLADRPKVLAEVAGRPFLAFLLEQLATAGVRRVILCTGYRGNTVAETFGETFQGVSLVYSQEPRPLGTGGALRHARSHLRSDPILVLNGDSYCDVDVSKFVSSHHCGEFSASLLLTHVAETSRFGSVAIDEVGVIRGFQEKAGGGPGWINAGMYLISQTFLENLPHEEPLSLERQVFPHWVGRGLTAYCHSGCFVDIGTPESYASVALSFAVRNRGL